MGNATNSPTRNNIKIKVNNGAYQNISADISQLNTTGYTSYHDFKDITSIVKAAGVNARFTVANIPFVNDGHLSQSIGVNWMALLHTFSFLAKAVFFLFLFMWVRWTIPRFRYDQLMNLGWKILIPLALFNMLVTGALILLQQNNWHF